MRLQIPEQKYDNEYVYGALLHFPAAASDLVSMWISINGAFIRSPETNKQKGRPVMKQIQLQPRTTVAQFNEHFTQVLRSR